MYKLLADHRCNIISPLSLVLSFCLQTYEMRSLYNAYDITEQLRADAPNAIAVMLGNGWPDGE